MYTYRNFDTSGCSSKNYGGGKPIMVMRDTQVIIDLEKIKYNMKLIKDMVGSDVAIMPVVKANGYGHGASAIAPTLMECGATHLAVATLTEALELRAVCPNAPILIMEHTPNRLLETVVKENITQTVFSLEQVKELGAYAQALNKIVKVHIKVDTGFHRLGKMPSDEYAEEIFQMFQVKNVEVEGIFSHLALVNDEENQKQYDMFCQFINILEDRGLKFKYKHIADSIACVDYPEYRLNMIRPGALLYGMRGSHKATLPVEQALTFRTAISQLHHISAGEGVGYDYLWKASKDSIIATLPFGYADGYPRNLRDKGYVIVNGVKCMIVGVICMDQCMADVTDVPNVEVGHEAIIYGNGENGSMTIAEAAQLAGTNKNDIIARISARPPRVYV
jgi:alanine racemase